MQLLKQSTASTILVGPLLDSAGAAVTTAVIGDFNLTKNGTTAALAASATATHSHNGHYLIALTTSNTDTLGRLTISANNSAHAMATHRYSVLLSSVFDAVITNAANATGGLLAATGAVAGISGTLATAADIATIKKNAFVATELAIATVTSQTVFVLTGGPTNDIPNVMVIIYDASDAAARIIAEGSYVGSTGTLTLTTATAITVTTSDTVTLVAVAATSTSVNVTQWGGVAVASANVLIDGGITAAKIATDAIAGAKVAADAVTKIQSGLATAANLAIVAGYLDTEIAAILADTNELQTDWANGGRLDLLLDGAASAGDPWTTTLPGSYSGSQAGKILSDILTDTGTTLQAELDGIQADTEDIQSRLPAALVSGRIDVSVGAMAANVITASALQTDAVSEIADGILSRNASNVEGTAGEHTLCTVILAMLENSISGTTLTIKRTDGSTTHATKTLTVNAAAEPITGIT